MARLTGSRLRYDEYSLYEYILYEYQGSPRLANQPPAPCRCAQATPHSPSSPSLALFRTRTHTHTHTHFCHTRPYYTYRHTNLNLLLARLGPAYLIDRHRPNSPSPHSHTPSVHCCALPVPSTAAWIARPSSIFNLQSLKISHRPGHRSRTASFVHRPQLATALINPSRGRPTRPAALSRERK